MKIIKFLRIWQFAPRFGTTLGLLICIPVLVWFHEWWKSAELLIVLWAVWPFDNEDETTP